jgi:hypothetical protein
MGTRLADSARNKAVDGVTAQINTGASPAVIQVRSGAQPATPATVASGTLLATFTLPNPAFGAAATGSAALLGVPITAAFVAAGTAGWFRVLDRGGAAVYDGTVATSGAELNLSSTTVAAGVDLILTSGSFAFPMGT